MLWLFSTPLLVVEVKVVHFILGFIVNSCDIKGQIFVKFMLQNSTYLQGSRLWIISSVTENGYNSPHSSQRTWIVLLPPFSSPLLILFAFFGSKLFSTYSTHGQSGCLSCMHSSPSSSSYVLPALYILIPQFPLSIPLPRYSFGLFPFSHKASIPAPLLSPMSRWWLLTPGLFSLRVICFVFFHFCGSSSCSNYSALLKTTLFFLALVQGAS